MSKVTRIEPSAAARPWPPETPVVFAVRPTKFEVVAPDQLKAWESVKAHSLGLSSEQFAQLRAGGGGHGSNGVGTWSFSPIGDGYDTFDDSDEI